MLPNRRGNGILPGNQLIAGESADEPKASGLREKSRELVG